MQQVSQLGSDQFNDLLKQLANAPQQGNRAPLVYGQMPTQFADEGSPFRLDIAPNFFIDADTSDPLQIEMRQADGSALPDWLHWDASRLTLQGVPEYANTGKRQLAVIATDRQGASSQVSFTLVTSAINRAPILNQAPAYLGWQLNTNNQFELSSTLFTDPNEDDILTYQVTLPNGANLPGWLRFDRDRGLLTGTPSPNDLYRPLRLKVTATDRGGLSNSTVLTMVAATIGTDADDVLSGTAADDYLQGFGGNDKLQGASGQDILSGGSDDDVLIGGPGSDTYWFDSDWGWDEIYEIASAEDHNIISFGEGFNLSDIVLNRDLTSFSIRQSGHYDMIKVSSVDGSLANSAGLISALHFQNGEVWNIPADQDISFVGFLDDYHTAFTGSKKDDFIFTGWINSTIDGDDGDDKLFGNSGDDQLIGGAGDDILDGGSGNDFLSGGPGDDYYFVSSGSGKKIINNTGGEDTLVLSDIDHVSDLYLSRSGEDLLAGFAHATGSVTIKHFFQLDGAINTGTSIDQFEFADGSQMSAASLLLSAGLGKPSGQASSSTPG
jgi:Ca2+-binding RTX toxin-like protein